VSGGLAASLRALRKRRSIILCYHGVAPSTAAEDPDFLRVHPDRFAAQVEMLRGAGFEFVTAAQLAAGANGGTPPPGLAALTFDDGMEDNHSVLLPLLREHALPATVYVSTGLIGKPNPWIAASAGARMMTEDELRELAAGGVEIGAHTVTHPDMSQLPYEDCLREMADSRAELQRISGQPVRTFAYPFCKYGEPAVRAARDAGFDAAVTCHGRGGWTPYEMKRTMITGKDGTPSFVAKLWELYGPLFDSAPGKLARASTRGARRQLRSLRER
jgi:peptidoglycan/xylan/chitin deacetylase (PgdA/CDA1 family)